MTAGRLRNIPTTYNALAPVRFETADGRRFEVDHWRPDGPPPHADGKPTGVTTLVIVLKEVIPPST